MNQITFDSEVAATLFFLLSEMREIRPLTPDEKEIFRHLNITMTKWAEEKEDACSKS